MKKISVLVVILFLLATIAITTTTNKKRCNVNDDCERTLVCLNEKCSYCTSDEQCMNKDYTLSCKPTTTTFTVSSTRVCQQKNLLDRFSILQDGVATVTTFMASVLANIGGLAGGGLFVPLLIGIGRFPIELAVPVSKSMMFGSSLATVIQLLPERHPHSPRVNRPLIDYDAALLLEPSTLSGTMLGVMLNAMFPNWLITLLITCLFSLTSYRMFKHAIRSFQSENINTHNTNEMVQQVEEEEGIVPQNIPALERIQLQESKHQPVTYIVLCIFWVLVLIISLFREYIQRQACHHHLQLLVVIILLLSTVSTIVACYFISRYLIGKYREKIACGYMVVGVDVIQWSTWNCFLFASISSIAGVIASLLGVGGGVIKQPLLLEMGMHPLVARATATFMILFTSSLTTVQYLIMGRLPLDYCIHFWIVGFLSSFLGQFLLKYFMSRFKRTSIVIFAVAITVSLATILMTGVGVNQLLFHSSSQRLWFQWPSSCSDNK